MPKKPHPEVVPLVKRRGSPRPGAEDRTSIAIFGSGHRAEWNPERWAEWLDTTDHEADIEPLLERCPRQPLLNNLVLLYALPIGLLTTRAMLQRARRALTMAQRAVVQLRLAPLTWLDGSGVAPAQLWLDLSGVNLQLALLVRPRPGSRFEDLAETHILARLTALVRASTGQWHDREMGALVAVFLGRTFSDAAKARAEWRRRNRSLVQAYLTSRDAPPACRRRG